jgi:hypothetical protein
MAGAALPLGEDERNHGGGGQPVLLANNNAWYNLGNGEYSPRCPSWQTQSGQLIFIQLTKAGGDWKTTTDPCATACGCRKPVRAENLVRVMRPGDIR